MFNQPTPSERAGRVALATLLLAIVGVAGYRWGARSQGDGSAALQGGDTGSALGSNPLVDVKGAVKRPGVYSLAAGSRIVDALKAAGGQKTDADLDSIDLAAKVIDGEQVVVPQKNSDAGSSQPVEGNLLSAKEKMTSGTISLNTSKLEDLEKLPGVGPATAQKIIDWRNGHGSFSNIDQLKEVGGIGDKKLSKIAPFVRL